MAVHGSELSSGGHLNASLAARSQTAESSSAVVCIIPDRLVMRWCREEVFPRAEIEFVPVVEIAHRIGDFRDLISDACFPDDAIISKELAQIDSVGFS